MPKREAGTHWRYIAFKIDAERTFPRNEFLDSMMRRSRGTRLFDSFRITVFEGNFGILKVPHFLKDEAIEALSGIRTIAGEQCTVTTLRSSGTIKTLKTRYREHILDAGPRGSGE
jgi:RNase P/RNase MRP subunit POP5